MIKQHTSASFAIVGVENFRPHENNDTQLPTGVEDFRPLQPKPVLIIHLS